MKTLFIQRIILVLTVFLAYLPAVTQAGRRTEIEEYVFTNNVSMRSTLTVSNSTLAASTTAADPQFRVSGYSLLNDVSFDEAYARNMTLSDNLIISTNAGGFGYITLGGVPRNSWPTYDIPEGLPPFLADYTLALWAFRNGPGATREDGSPWHSRIQLRINNPITNWLPEAVSGKFGNSFNAASGQFVVPQAGYYLILASLTGLNNADGGTPQPGRDMFVMINGQKRLYVTTDDASSQVGYHHSRLTYLYGGDTVAIGIFQEGGYLFIPEYAELTIFFFGAQPWGNTVTP